MHTLVNFYEPLIDDKHFLIYLSFLKTEKILENKEGTQEPADYLNFIRFLSSIPFSKPLIMVIIFLWAHSNSFTSKPRFDTVLNQCQVQCNVFLTNVGIFINHTIRKNQEIIFLYLTGKCFLHPWEVAR